MCACPSKLHRKNDNKNLFFTFFPLSIILPARGRFSNAFKRVNDQLKTESKGEMKIKRDRTTQRFTSSSRKTRVKNILSERI